jgi:hypothetical protein
MKSLFLTFALFVISLPAMAVDWDAEKKKMWGADQEQQLQEYQMHRQDQIRDYQRQWSYDQRNRGYAPESQTDRYRAYDYGQRTYDYRTP